MCGNSTSLQLPQHLQQLPNTGGSQIENASCTTNVNLPYSFRAAMSAEYDKAETACSYTCVTRLQSDFLNATYRRN